MKSHVSLMIARGGAARRDVDPPPMKGKYARREHTCIGQGRPKKIARIALAAGDSVNADTVACRRIGVIRRAKGVRHSSHSSHHRRTSNARKD